MLERWVSPVLWIHRKHFLLTDETSPLALHPLSLDRVWMPGPSAHRQHRLAKNSHTDCSQIKSLLSAGPLKLVSVNASCPFSSFENKLNHSGFRHWWLTGDAHLLVEEDPVELSWWGEESFSHAEFTGGDLDAGAGVDWSSCGARGGNLFKKTKSGDRRSATLLQDKHQSYITAVSYYRKSFTESC